MIIKSITQTLYLRDLLKQELSYKSTNYKTLMIHWISIINRPGMSK